VAMTEYEKHITEEWIKAKELIKTLRNELVIKQGIINKLNVALSYKQHERVSPPMFKPVTVDFNGITEGMDNE